MRTLLSAIVLTVTLGFLAWYGLRHLEDLPHLAWRDGGFWTNVAVALVWYNVAVVMAAANWRWLLRSLGDRSRPGLAESIFLITQVARYLPGNVAHFVGRIALAKARGIAVTMVSASLLSEQALLAVSAMLFVAIGFLLVPEALLPLMPYIPAAHWLAVVLLAGALVPLFLGTLAGWAGRRLPARLRPYLVDLGNVGLLKSAGLVVVNWVIFVLLGAVVVAVAEAVSGTPALPLAAAAVVFTGAWVLGFLTPGAPAGIGVRETILVIGFAPMIGEGPALSVAVAMRLLSVVGDGLAFLIGFAGDRLLRDAQLARDA